MEYGSETKFRVNKPPLKLTQKGKGDHFNKYLQDNKLNIYETWQRIREIINISKRESNNINCIPTGRNTITNSSDIANEFNTNFTSVSRQIEEKLVKRNIITPNI